MHRKSRYLPPCAFLMALAATGLHAQQLPETAEDIELAKAADAETPKTPMELPPNPPTVTCKDGQLSIVAENSTMGSVLALVHGCIGAAIDAPQGSAGTRMYAKLGPGPANEILQSLLSSTDFDYVIEPSPSNPRAIQTVMIMTRSKDGKDQPLLAADRAMTPQRRAWLEARHNARPYDDITDESHAVEAEPAPVVESVVPVTPAPPDAAAPPPAGAAPPDPAKTATTTATTTADAAPAPPSNDASAAPPDPNGDSPAAKAVQEKITTMQQLFEQRKQQMIQNQAPPQPANPQ